MESDGQAKIVERTKRGKDYLWKLTEFGRAEGLAVIESLKEGGDKDVTNP